MKLRSLIGKGIIALSALNVATACSDMVDYEFSNYHCNLTIDNNVHLDATLASSMNHLSPGVFTTIKPDNKDGVYYFYFQNNQGLVSEKRFNAIDERLQSHLRIGMNKGLIVGFGNLDAPARFYAYDLQCPNCFDINSLPFRSFELTISGTGFATCKTCQRTYNLNTGGNIVSGDRGKTLTRYRANTAGPNGMLSVR